MKLLLTVLILSIWLFYKTMILFMEPSMPKIAMDQYWGSGDPPSKINSKIKPFKILFDDDMILDLQYRLQNSRYSDSYDNIDYKYGFNAKALTPILKYWSSEYNFTKRQKFMNQFDQFITNIQGLDIHYLHIKPKFTNKRIIPIIMLHGWPGSVCEFHKIIPLLTERRDDYDFVFELIIPSLPGFGFSQAARKPGLGTVQMAVIMSNLMDRLGFEKYYIHGGDWGSIIGSHMTKITPERILGYHTTMAFVNTPLSNLKLLIGSIWPYLFAGDFQHKLYPISVKLEELIELTGYLHIQATKPNTLGVSLDNSPAGLAAWVLEKFIGMADNKLSEELKYTYEELIDNLMLYWSSKSASSSLRIYAESINIDQLSLGLDSISTSVPTAIARLPEELLFYTKCQLSEIYKNIVQISDFPRGGHFSSMEEPELLADDIFLGISKC